MSRTVTPRQREIIFWSSQGKTQVEVAEYWEFPRTQSVAQSTQHWTEPVPPTSPVWLRWHYERDGSNDRR